RDFHAWIGQLRRTGDGVVSRARGTRAWPRRTSAANRATATDRATAAVRLRTSLVVENLQVCHVLDGCNEHRCGAIVGIGEALEHILVDPVAPLPFEQF